MAHILNRRQALQALARGAQGGLITTAQAASVLRRDAQSTAVYLSRLQKGGWIARLRRGMYLVLPLESSPGHQTAEDTWVLATALFSPCYIGGWSAAEYWELTEQIFADTFVVSAANVRSRHPHTAGAKFRIARVDVEDLEGVTAVWRGPVRVSVSDRERTISDGLTHPEWMGGMRHLLDALRAHRESRAWNGERLLASVRAHGSGAAAKRLGYLAEMFLGVPTDFINTLVTNRTRGIVKLDPALPATGSINSRWGLRINTQLSLRDSE